MKKKVILAVGTDFIGKYFMEKFNNLGYEVKIISTKNKEEILNSR